MVDLANTVWRDFATAGIPASGANQPKKSKIRQWGTYIESLTQAASYGNTVWFATKSALDGDLAHDAGTPAIVYADTTAANNGIYIKAGASGAGSWAQIITYLPGYQFVTATDAGAGAANAIVATSSPRVAYTDGVQLIRLNIFEANTSGTVTVAFDGGTALTIKTASNNNPAVGGLGAGMTILGVVDQSASVFRMLSDQASAAIVADAEAAQIAASTAQGAAEAAAALSAQRFIRVRVVDTGGGDPSTGYEAGDSIDGITLVAGDLILRATPDGDPSDGIYVASASGAASRSAQFDTYDKHPGTAIRVVTGTDNAGTEWRINSAFGGTLESTDILIEEFTSGSSVGNTITLKSFGAVGDGTADDDDSLGAFLTAAANAIPEVEAIVDSGTYRFDTPRQLLNPFGTLRGQGQAVLKYVGGAVTNVLSLSDASQNRYQQTIRDLTIQGNADSQVLLYMDKVNHAIIENIDFRDAHPGNAALQTVFCVLGKFRDIRCSYAEAFSISTPLNGLYLGTGTSSATQTIACTFDSVIIEGVGGDGIVIVNGWDNTFTGGTSEGNTGWGVRILDYSRRNLFNTMFFEANTSGDLWIQGHENIFINCEAVSTAGASGAAFIDGGDYNKFIGGRYHSINIGSGAAGTLLESLIVDTLTDNGSGTIIRNCYTSGGVRIPDKSPFVSLPRYTDGTRPTPPTAERALIWNDTVNRPQVWDGSGWFSIAI